ncbi:MAG: histidine--tRNA ligase [Chlamydiales bacterium]|nr:histidine--tRNA ligase [Chlamydiales bacterium]
MNYRIPKGVFDILPDDEEMWRSSHLWRYVESVVREIADTFGYREIRTPLFETTELFQRGIGTTTDIVTKEMYTFHDRANRSMTLRPEGTAPVMRAFIEKHLEGVHKLFYLAPMFRYERQQAGRYRQHHQFGVEAVGVSSPFQDVEVIELLHTLYTRLGLRNLTLHVNSIGDLETRKKFRHALKAYLKPHFNELSTESQQRYETNPLRILDSKNANDKKILEEAPSILDFLEGAAKEHFDGVLSLLTIPFEVNPRLVRGLDYYNNTVFEITAGELGAQNSIGGGGRYDGLMKQLGGADLPAFGFGTGLERIIQTCLAQGVTLPKKPATALLLIPLGEEAKRVCFKKVASLRTKGIAAEMDFTGKKLKQVMRYADRSGTRFVAVIGEEELQKNNFELKEMESGKVEKLTFEKLEKRLKDV